MLLLECVSFPMLPHYRIYEVPAEGLKLTPNFKVISRGYCTEFIRVCFEAKTFRHEPQSFLSLSEVFRKHCKQFKTAI